MAEGGDKKKINRRLKGRKQRIVLNAEVSKRKRSGVKSQGGKTESRGKKRLVLAAAALAAAVVAVYLSRGILIEGAGFRVTRIEVRNGCLLGEKEIKELAGIPAGASLLSLDIGNIRSRIRNHPDVNDAMVKRRIPGKVIIKVFERFPVAAIHCGKRFVLDEEGVVLSSRNERRNRSLPFLTGLDCKDVAVGDRLCSPPLKKALDVVNTYRQTKLCRQVDLVSVDVRDPKNTILRTDKIEEIRLGSRDVKERLSLLSYILEQRRVRGIDGSAKYIDLRWNSIAEMPVSETGAGKS